MQENSLYSEILSELQAIKKQLLLSPVTTPIIPDWITKQDAMKFLGYQETTMSVLLKSGELVVSNIGARKFIHRDSIIKLLEKNCG